MLELNPKSMPPFLDAYMYNCGISEIPDSYNYWTAISTIASSLGKRVYLQKGHSPIYPNLYVFLIGPSGTGKNAAIDIGYRLIRVPAFEDSINPSRIASFTGIALLDLLGERLRWKDEITSAVTAKPLYLITPEIGESLGEMPQARSSIKHLTDWYSGEDYPLIDLKRSQGGKTVLKGHCFNWISGSTESWLIECIPKSAMQGGFLPRVVAVLEDMNYDKRIPIPEVPDNYKQIQLYLRQWLYLFTQIDLQNKGKPVEVRLTQSAKDINKEWYLTRPEPSHPDLHPTWKRQHDLTLKLATILSIADPNEWEFTNIEKWWTIDHRTNSTFRYSQMIRDSHIIKAQELSTIVIRNAPVLLNLVALNANSEKVQRVEDLLKQLKQARRSTVLNQLHRYISAKDLDIIEQSLLERNVIKVRMVGKGTKKAKEYTWTGGVRIKDMREIIEDDDAW